MEAERARYKLLKEQSDKAYELEQAQQKAERDAIRAAARKKQEEVAAQRAREQAEAERQVRKITEMQLLRNLHPLLCPLGSVGAGHPSGGTKETAGRQRGEAARGGFEGAGCR